MEVVQGYSVFGWHGCSYHASLEEAQQICDKRNNCDSGSRTPRPILLLKLTINNEIKYAKLDTIEFNKDIY